MVSNKLFTSGSVRVGINKNYVCKDGTCQIFLQVLIGRKKKTIDLGLKWPPHKFQNGQCVMRGKGDDDYSDYNMIIQDNLHRGMAIFKEYRMMNRPLSMDQFIYDFHSNFSADDFLSYMERRIKDRWNNGAITTGTKNMQMVIFRKLQRFRNPLNFQTIDNRTAEQFETYLIKVDKIKSLNTRWGNHKVFKTYLNEAKKDGYRFIDTYKDFKVKKNEGLYEALTQTELQAFYGFYMSNNTTKTERATARRFLFMCLTGLRISDALRFMPSEMVTDGVIRLEMHKTRRDQKNVEVPISKVAQQLIDDGLEETNGLKPFVSPSEIYANRLIKRIATRLGIKKRIHSHVGRETFATLYMEADGKLEVLKELMGHHSITMTNKYTKVTRERKKEEGKRIDGFL